jgi:hypothetical protein
MCRDNGGELVLGKESWMVYSILDDTDRKLLKRSCNDVVRETASAREWSGFPPNALAIAHDGTGDLLVLLADPGTDRYGEPVFRWDHESVELTQVASTFEELPRAMTSAKRTGRE